MVDSQDGRDAIPYSGFDEGFIKTMLVSHSMIGGADRRPLPTLQSKMEIG
ncbi:MAG: hypothetical protein ACYC27_17930 [Armatimonadota bacterium]